jgi:hypothetical protein
MAAKTNSILMDLLWQVSAIREKMTSTSPPPAAEGGEGGEPQKGPSAFETIGNTLLKVLGPLGPLAILGKVIGTTSSGFGVFQAALGALAAVLAPIVLPLFISLAGALLDFSGDLEKAMSGGIVPFMNLIFGTLIPVLGFLADSFLNMIDILSDAMLWIAKFPESLSNAIAEFLHLGGASDADNAKMIADARESGLGDDAIRALAVSMAKTGDEIDRAFKIADGKDTGEGDFSGATGAGGSVDAPASGGRTGTDDALASLKLALGGKASFSGLADVGRQAQLAGLNADPIQMKILASGLRSAAAAEESLAIMRRGAGIRGAGPAPVPRGDMPPPAARPPVSGDF